MEDNKSSQDFLVWITYLNPSEAIIRVGSFPNIADLNYFIGENGPLSPEEVRTFLSGKRFARGTVVDFLLHNGRTNAEHICRIDFTSNWLVDYGDRVIERPATFTLPKSLE